MRKKSTKKSNGTTTKRGSSASKTTVKKENVLDALDTAVTLEDTEIFSLRTLDQDLGKLKLALADAELHRAQLIRSIEQKQQKMMETATSVALAHGIDLNSPDSGKWRLNLTEMEFLKTE